MDSSIEGLSDGLLAAAICDAAPDAILVVRAGTIVHVNRMAERLFGYERRELLGQPIELLVPSAHRHAHAAQRQRFEVAPRVREMGSGAVLEAQRKNGDRVPVEISLSPLEMGGVRLTIASVRDVTRRRQLEEQLRFASTHDALTDLFNRAHLDTVRAELEASKTVVGVVMADVDGLKPINDRFGHEAGDQVLRRCGAVLRAGTPADAVVARLGGDEFAILLPHATQQALDECIARVREDLARHNELTRAPKLEISVGSALSERRGGISQAMRLADSRMYEDKARRRARV